MTGETNIEPDSGAECSSRSPDPLIAELAERQHGVVGRSQLVGLGMGRRAIGHRVERQRLHPVHRGVYAVGRRRLTRSGVWMAAVLACGPGAVLSHRSAAVLWSIRRRDPMRVDVTAPRGLRGRPGIRAHQATPPSDETTKVDGIPTTTAARTLLDLAGVLTRHELARAMEQAEALRLADSTPLAALLSRYPARRGTTNLKGIMERESTTAGITRSELEDGFLAFVAERGLPPPRKNVWLEVDGDWLEADCAWPEHRVVVELDSWTYHGTAAAFRRDRVRDRRVRLAGWEPVRVTSWDLEAEPDQLEAHLTGLLALTSARRATP